MHLSQIAAFAGRRWAWRRPLPDTRAGPRRPRGHDGLRCHVLYLVIAVWGCRDCQDCGPVLTIVKYAGCLSHLAGHPVLAAEILGRSVGRRSGWLEGHGYGSLITLANPKAILF